MNILLPAEPKENNPVDINQLRTRILIYLMYISGGCTYALLPIWARVFIEDFSFSNGQVGLLTSADMASTALAAFLGRFWIDKVYWRKVMPVVLIVTAIANVLCAFSESFSSLLMLRYIAGFGTGSIAVFTYGTLSAVEKPDREFAFASAISVAVGIALLTISPTMIISLKWTSFALVHCCYPHWCLRLKPFSLSQGLTKHLVKEDVKTLERCLHFFG